MDLLKDMIPKETPEGTVIQSGPSLDTIRKILKDELMKELESLRGANGGAGAGDGGEGGGIPADLLSRLEALENEVSDLGSNVGKTGRLAKQNEGDIEDLRTKLKKLGDKISGKVDMEVFDEEITLIKNYLSSAGGSGGGGGGAPDGTLHQERSSSSVPVMTSGASSREVAKLKEQCERIPELEEMLNKLLK